MTPVIAVAVVTVVVAVVVAAGAVVVIVAIVYDGGTLSEGGSEVWLSCRDNVRERGGVRARLDRGCPALLCQVCEDAHTDCRGAEVWL